jgi:hypothetical protein
MCLPLHHQGLPVEHINDTLSELKIYILIHAEFGNC